MPFLRINNTKINYVTGEDGITRGRKSLLFIHGGGGNHKAWLIALRHLKGDCNRIAIELPGHGESNGVGENDINKYSKWIREVIEGLSLETCFLIGHSMGGAITLSFSLRYPQYLDGIILVGTGAVLEVRPDIQNGIQNNFTDAVKLICKLAYSDRISPFFIEMGEKEMLRTRPEVFYGDICACNAFDVLKDIGRIEVPTLIVSGSEDKLTCPEYSHFLHENIKGSRLAIIRNAGHMVMIEKPREFNKEIEDFISNLPCRT